MRRLIASVCGLTDPFCVHAIGAKYPDASSLRSLPWTLHGRTQLASNAAGNGALLFLPNYINAPFLAATAIALPPTASFGNFSDATANRVASVNAFRLVSWGMRLKNVVAPLAAGGMVHVRSLTNREGFGLGQVDMTTYSRSESLDIPLQDCRDVHIVGSRTDQRPADWYPAGLTGAGVIVTNWQSPGFNPVSVYVTGVPATAGILDIEFIYHYELQFDDTSDLGLLATPAPIANPLLASAASAAQSAAKHFFNQSASAVASFLERRAATAIGTLLGGPVGGATAGMLALTVD